MKPALVKVEAPSDFAFSTRSASISRKIKWGEIWLYLPKGSKLLTIKRPEWGVLRDYRSANRWKQNDHEAETETAQACSIIPGEARHHREVRR